VVGEEESLSDKAPPIAIPPGMVYTDTDGKIVYANRQFLEMLAIASSDAPTGQTLAGVLHVEPTAIHEFVMTRERYAQRELVVVYRRVDGTTAMFLLTSSPSYDQRNKYVGMNIGVEPRRDGQGLEKVPLVTAVGYALPAGQKPAVTLDPGLNGQYLEMILNALQGMLARMAGPRMREGLVKVVADNASQHDWPLYVDGDQLVLERYDIPAETCANLISEALEYAVAVLGQRVVLYEIDELYAQLDPRIQEYALQSGLSLPLIKRLAT